MDVEQARKRAREADAALARGEIRGPLHGVPFTLKDAHATAGVQPLLVVDNSEFTPKHLTVQETCLILASTGALPAPHFKRRGFVCPFICSCTCSWSASSSRWRLLWRLDWLPLQPTHSRGRAIHSLTQRLLKPRTPLDCPACRLPCTHSSVVGTAPLPVRPWREMKSRRGAPKRVNTEGFACPNHQCPYFGNTDAQIHALVGDGKHGSAERIQTFRCQACHTTFSSRRNTPLYRLKTPSRAGSQWCCQR